jgi:hypothetical protein
MGENLQGDGRKKVGARMRGIEKEFPLSWRKQRKRMRPGSAENVT